jgi:hypothetical protein
MVTAGIDGIHQGQSLEARGRSPEAPPEERPSCVKRLLRTYEQEVLNLLTPPPRRGCYTCQQRSFWQDAVTSR